MQGRIGLSDAIELLREELQTALAAGRGKDVQFTVGPIDLEFLVEVAREGGGSAKVRFWVVEAGADAKVSSTSTQVVKIRLEPVDAVTKKQMQVAETETSAAGQNRRAPVAATG